MDEIERKFRVEWPDVEDKIHSEGNLIKQFYIIGWSKLELRGRIKIDKMGRENDKYNICLKIGQGLIRKEYDKNVSKRLFNIFEKLNKGRRYILKERYEVNLGEGKKGVYDKYLNSSLNNLETIEIEFDSKKDSDRFNIPDYFGEELTNDESYKNKNLYKKIIRRR